MGDLLYAVWMIIVSLVRALYFLVVDVVKWLFEWLWESNVGAVIVTIVVVLSIYKIVKRRRAVAAARKADDDAWFKQLNAEHDGYYKQMIALCENSLTLFESMPGYLMSAEGHLNQAEIDFADGAFSPFWDSIEDAAKSLGRFDEGVQKVKNISSQYTGLIERYVGVPPQFPLERKTVEKLAVGTSTAERMKAIVRTAQRDFQFSSIYEQRKTNQILVAGFTNLGQALDRMTWQITDSIDNLTSSVESMASTLNESINMQLAKMTESNTQNHGEVMKAESEHVLRERKALEMLDNIQRHRKPTI